MIKAHVRYTIDCDYFFSEKEMKQIVEDNDGEPMDSIIRNWIEEDFNEVETRADNVLPQYSSDLEIQINA